jgi:hypothetical protein
MNEYTILRPIVLGFLTHNDSYDMIIGPENGHLKFDGHDIIFIDSKGIEHVSHTSNNAIDLWLERGSLELKHE